VTRKPGRRKGKCATTVRVLYEDPLCEEIYSKSISDMQLPIDD